MQQSPRSPSTFDTGDKAMAAVVFTGFGAGVLVWLGAACAALVAGAPVPRHQLPVKMAHLLRRPGQPSAAWGERMPTAGWYWTITATLTVLIASVVITGYVLIRRHTSHVTARPAAPAGAGVPARRHDRRRPQSRAAPRRRSPPLPHQTRTDTGGVPARPRRRRRRVGVGRGLDAAARPTPLRQGPAPGHPDDPRRPRRRRSPPRTRPDNITATLTARQAHGPVAVFDPQGLAPHVTARLRWSPIRGCDYSADRDDPRPRPRGRNIEGGGGQRLLARPDRSRAPRIPARRRPRPPHPRGPVPVVPLARGGGRRRPHPRRIQPFGGGGWAEALNAAIQADPRTRDSIWAGVRAALARLADPHVLDAITPRDGHHLDPEQFLTGTGTLYLLGTAAGAGAAANLSARSSKTSSKSPAAPPPAPPAPGSTRPSR